MPPAQPLLFPDPQPLVERFGRDFFLGLPSSPGVYLMRDAAGAALYVGKAKNLRKRLGNYRVANPDRMPRRHLRLLRAVARIELRECPDESTALAVERELLRTLKPRFNRAGTWPAPARFLVWRRADDRLEITVTRMPEAGWRQLGPLGSGAVALRMVLVRLLWFAVQPERGILGLPAGWVHGRLEPVAAVPCGALTAEADAALETVAAGAPSQFGEWIRVRLREGLHPVEQAMLEQDLEFVNELEHVIEWPHIRRSSRNSDAGSTLVTSK